MASSSATSGLFAESWEFVPQTVATSETPGFHSAAALPGTQNFYFSISLSSGVKYRSALAGLFADIVFRHLVKLFLVTSIKIPKNPVIFHLQVFIPVCSVPGIRRSRIQSLAFSVGLPEFINFWMIAGLNDMAAFSNHRGDRRHGFLNMPQMSVSKSLCALNRTFQFVRTQLFDKIGNQRQRPHDCFSASKSLGLMVPKASLPHSRSRS